MNAGNSRRAFEALSEQFERNAIERLLKMTSGRGFMRVQVSSDPAQDRLEIDLVRRADGTWGIR